MVTLDPLVEGFELSPQQKQLWRSIRHGGEEVFAARCKVRVEGPLEPEALAAAIADVRRRHELLRTRFQVLPGMTLPLQVVAGEADGAPEVLDFSLRPLAPERFLLTLDLPALYTDRAGLIQLVREIAAALARGRDASVVESGARGEAGTPDEEPLQYIDLAAWQNELLSSEETASGREFWAQREIAPHLELDLPFARARRGGWDGGGEARAAFAPRRVRSPLPADLVTAVEERCGEWELAPALFYLAAWATLLGRFGERREVLVGVGVDGRRFAEMESSPGLLARTLPVMAEAVPERPFSRLVAGLDAALREVSGWQESFDWEHLPGWAGSEPFFPLAFDFDEPPPELEAGGLTLAVLEASALIDRFHLRLAVTAGPEGVATELCFDPELFAEAEVRRLLRRLQTLLAAFAADPERPLAAPSLLSAAERQQLLVEGDARVQAEVDVQDEAGTAGCFHQWVFAWAEETPEAPAVRCGGESLSYGELAAEAGRLARSLRRLGAGPEVRVALIAERSADTVVGLLGILAAGAAYVPLEPTLPAARLAFLLTDSGARVVVGREGLGAGLPRLPARSSPAPGAEGERLGDAAVGPGAVDPGNLVYVLYTSGSTGRPKGVAVEHRQLTGYLRGLAARLRLPAGISAATVSSFATDLGHTAIFPTLAAGGCLTVVEADRAADPAALSELFAAAPVDLLKIVPSHLEALLAVEARPQILPRRWLVLGGEACRPGWAAGLASLAAGGAPGCRVVNHYGPTETTVGVLTHEVGTAGPDPRLAASLPLGRPLAGAAVYLVDRRGEPVPPWLAGELLVAGVGVARGYLGQPGKTGERFIPDPFGPGPGGRLYRTGDLVRRLPDGTLEFLGRADSQVKVRGFRIELQEVEEALLEHPAVRQAVVVARGVEGGEGRLVAYATVDPSPPAPALQELLEEHLAQRLPDFMQPQALVLLDELPRLPSGKVDRRSLPAPEATAGGPPPRTATEELLASVWAGVLGVSRIGSEDHFFRLGGSSLQATQVISRIRQTFGIELSIRALFEAPVLAELGERVEAAMGAGSRPEVPPIEAVPRQGDLPLSFAQTRLWFLQQLEPGSVAYNIAGGVALAGRLAAAALEAALVALVRRHESLRTTFADADGEPVQVISPAASELAEATSSLLWIDLSSLPEAVRRGRIEALAAAAAQRPFDLACGPLLRVVLLRLAPAEHVLVLVMHHVISDGWSLGILVRELAAVYARCVRGTGGDPEPPTLPPLDIQYADFAAWQRRWLAGEVLARELDWWRQRLAGLPPLLDLGIARPRSALVSGRGGRHGFVLPAHLARELRRLSQARGVTLFMTLLAAFQALLSRYSGQRDIPLGVPIANRNFHQIEGLIGFFANTLVLRTHLDGDPTFDQLLARVREVTLGAYGHQDLPFERLVEELNPERDLSRSPLFQIMFALRNVPPEVLHLPGLTLTPMELDTGTAKFDLLLLMEEDADDLRGAFEYSLDLFEPTAIARLHGHFARLLAAVVERPGRPFGSLPLLAPAERHQVLVEWAGGPRRPPAGAEPEGGGSYRRRFAAQVAATPERVAASCRGHLLSYGELARRADGAARRLGAAGAGPEGVVAILADRGIDFLAGVVGILVAGAAYLPLDPRHPPGRLAQVLGASGALLAVACRPRLGQLREALSALTSPPAVAILEDLLAPAGTALDASTTELAVEPGPGDSPDHLAYVLYTSGSTGVPKGAMLHGRGMVSHVDALHAELDLVTGGAVAQTASQCFDISVWQLLGPLILGGRVQVVTDAEVTDPEALLDELVEADVGIAELVPSQMRMLLDEVERRGPAGPRLAGLRWMMPTGEALPPELCREWLAIFPHVPLWNAYGPTECSDDVTFRALRRPLPPGVAHAPIGRPLAGLQVYLLDPGFVPAPPGVPGELCVGGVGVGRGYLGDPRRTAASFVPDPFAAGLASGGVERGARLYRSGDLARHLGDGELEFLGRIDHQVKLRGYRLELGEIEARLLAHEAVVQAVVLAREDQPGDQRLVAYLVPEETWAGTDLTSELAACLGRQLPDYMVPTAFVELAAFPLSPNGKIDRKALPAPARGGWERGARWRPPGSPAEELLAGLWAQVLGLDDVGVDDDFFALGGHSLLATQLISRVRKAFRVELPLRSLFEAPTVAGLAGEIAAAGREGSAPQAPPIRPVPRDGELPLSFAQHRLWFIDQLDPGSAAYNMRIAVHLEGELDVAAVERALAAIVERHEVLRTSFAAVDGEPVQVIEPPAPLVVPLLDLGGLPSQRAAAEVRRLAGREGEHPFDLGRGPKLRVCLLRLGANDHAALFTVHHIASDGWSMIILLREFSLLYDAFSRGEASPLSPLPVQYADFAAWQRRWLSGAVLEESLAYWRRRLAGELPVVELPADRPRPATASYRGARHRFTLPGDLATDCAAFSRRSGVTLFMTLVAAFFTLLHRYSGQEDLMLGAEIANRNRREIEDLIGFFVNILMLRADLSDRPTFRELLAQVRETALDAYRHQDLPFEKLVEELQPERTAGKVPLVQVMFVMQNAPGRQVVPSGLTVRDLELEGETTKFDLLLAIEETADGLAGNWHYSTDLFNATTIERMTAHFETLLRGAIADPEARLAGLPMRTAEQKEERVMEKTLRKGSRMKGFLDVQPQAIRVAQESLVTTRTLTEGEQLPLLVEPAVAEFDLVDWATSERAWIEEKLLDHGALLFRNANVRSAADFERFAASQSNELFGDYGDLPREGLGGKVYTSTPYPPEQAILFHNESSQMHIWPRKQWFYCEQPAAEGGETPLVDCRRVYQLLDPEIRRPFEEKGLMYVRNFIPGIDVDWREFFRTEERARVEQYCRDSGITCEWTPDGGLRTRIRCRGVAEHPKTGEKVFFNQIQAHHISCLDPDTRESLLTLCPAERLPRNVYFGDGSPIPDAMVDEIRRLYESLAVSFTWRKGDVVMVDNMLTAHSRNPYRGPRKIVVAMGDMVRDEELG